MQVERYKISGVMRFSDDQVVCLNRADAEQELKEVKVAICGGTAACTKVEMLESSIELMETFEEED
jgi:hypothetical protein